MAHPWRHLKYRKVRTTQDEERSSSESEDLPDAPDAPDAPDEPEDTPVPQREFAQPISAFIPGEGIEIDCLMFYVGMFINKNAGIQVGRHWKVSHSMSLRRNG
jgi:hypothetical protein